MIYLFFFLWYLLWLSVSAGILAVGCWLTEVLADMYEE